MLLKPLSRYPLSPSCIPFLHPLPLQPLRPTAIPPALRIASATLAAAPLLVDFGPLTAVQERLMLHCVHNWIFLVGNLIVDLDELTKHYTAAWQSLPASTLQST